MFEADEFLRAAESRIAASAPLPEETRVAGIASRALRLRRRDSFVRWGGLAAGILVVAGAGAFAFLPDGKEAPLAPLSPIPSATAVEVQPRVIDGFVPLPQMPAAEIPWDEVGPGWFLFDYRRYEPYSKSSAYDADPECPGPALAEPEASGGFSLLAPDGTWYATLRYECTGGGYAVGWDGKSVWLTTSGTPDLNLSVASLRGVDIETGQATGDLADVNLGSATGIERGVLANFWFGGDGLTSETLRPGADPERLCPEFYQWEPYDMSGYVSPGARPQLVCFTRDGQKTQVSVVDVLDPSNAESLATFDFDVSRYQFLGWVDAETFTFALIEGDSLQSQSRIEKVFEYDLSTDAIVELPAGGLAGVGPLAGSQAIYDTASGYYVVERVERVEGADGASGAWSFDILDSNRELVVHRDLPSCSGVTDLDYFQPDQPTMLTSGGRLLVTCPGSAAGDGWIKTFTTRGFEDGDFHLGEGSHFSAFDHRG